jgi:SAM-dependent methyltransferase
VGDAERFPRRKERRPGIAATYRLYRALRRFLPRAWLTRSILGLSWLLDRLAWEQTIYWLGSGRALNSLRPHTRDFVRREAANSRRVLEFGGGPGVFTREIAAMANAVVYCDTDASQVEVTRRGCSDLDNVRVVLADGLDLARDDGPFDLAILLHVLEHLDEPEQVLTLLRETCDRIAIEVPDLDSMPALDVRRRVGAPYYWDDDHVTEFSASTLTETLRNAGWQLDELEKRSGCLLATASRPTHAPIGVTTAARGKHAA